MRVWGRVYPRDDAGQRIPNEPGRWVEVATAADGNNDDVWITAMAQEIQLNTNESPLYANRGIPAQESVIQQIFPDWWMWQIQKRYAQYFSSLVISKVPNTTSPVYRVNIINNQGAPRTVEIAT